MHHEAEACAGTKLIELRRGVKASGRVPRVADRGQGKLQLSGGGPFAGQGDALQQAPSAHEGANPSIRRRGEEVSAAARRRAKDVRAREGGGRVHACLWRRRGRRRGRRWCRRWSWRRGRRGRRGRGQRRIRRRRAPLAVEAQSCAASSAQVLRDRIVPKRLCAAGDLKWDRDCTRKPSEGPCRANRRDRRLLILRKHVEHQSEHFSTAAACKRQATILSGGEEIAVGQKGSKRSGMAVHAL